MRSTIIFQLQFHKHKREHLNTRIISTLIIKSCGVYSRERARALRKRSAERPNQQARAHASSPSYPHHPPEDPLAVTPVLLRLHRGILILHQHQAQSHRRTRLLRSLLVHKNIPSTRPGLVIDIGLELVPIPVTRKTTNILNAAKIAPPAAIANVIEETAPEAEIETAKVVKKEIGERKQERRAALSAGVAHRTAIFGIVLSPKEPPVTRPRLLVAHSIPRLPVLASPSSLVNLEHQ